MWCPKAAREELNIMKDSLIKLEAKVHEIILRPLDLWERVWGCCQGSAEEAEKELDDGEAE